MEKMLEAKALDKKGLIGEIDKSKIALNAEHCSCQCACDCICICDCDDYQADLYASKELYNN